LVFGIILDFGIWNWVPSFNFDYNFCDIGTHGCTLCGKSFRSKSILEAHKCDARIYGQGVKSAPGRFLYDGKWEFEQIGDEFFKCSTWGLTAHLRESHTGQISNLKCPFKRVRIQFQNLQKPCYFFVYIIF